MLCSDSNISVSWIAANALRSAFLQVTDKKQAWYDLIRLTFDNDSGNRWDAASVIESVFSHMPNKNKVWEDLHLLTSDSNSYVRKCAASALGNAFSHVSDKNKVWEDIYRLSFDTDTDVKACAYHSMGKASIFKSVNAENNVDFKKEIETAIEYFEKSLQQGVWSKPAKFCFRFIALFIR